MSRPASRRRSVPTLLSAAAVAALLCGGSLAHAHEVHGHAPPPGQGPQTTPEQDIAALAGFHRPAKDAAARLVERGEDVLPALHAAMLSSSANDEQRIQIATVVGEIGDPASIGPLIALAGAHPGQIVLRQAVLAMLGELPETEASAAFAERVLRDEAEHPLVRRKALVFFGLHRDERGRPWAARHRRDADPELEAAALYLAARLGDATARDPIVEYLRRPAPPSPRYALMLGLAELVSPAEFEALAPDYLRQSWEYASALRYARYRVGGREERLALWRDMIDSRSTFERGLAAAFLMQERGAEELAGLIEEGIPDQVRGAARRELRRAGYRVVPEGAGVRLERKEAP